jgi:histidinol dehydrogenase
MENQKHFGDNLISAIRNAASELEAFQLQVALGKAEANDKVDEVKTKFKGIIHDAKNTLHKGEAKFDELKGKLEHLEVQVALGKAEAAEVIEEQKKKISHAIHEIEQYVKSKF